MRRKAQKYAPLEARGTKAEMPVTRPSDTKRGISRYATSSGLTVRGNSVHGDIVFFLCWVLLLVFFF